jgi:hypothetical protein
MKRTSTKVSYLINDLKELTEEEIYNVLEHIRTLKDRAALNVAKVKFKSD